MSPALVLQYYSLGRWAVVLPVLSFSSAVQLSASPPFSCNTMQFPVAIGSIHHLFLAALY